MDSVQCVWFLDNVPGRARIKCHQCQEEYAWVDFVEKYNYLFNRHCASSLDPMPKVPCKMFTDIMEKNFQTMAYTRINALIDCVTDLQARYRKLEGK
jgi:hypothetical protein